jgi:hypothetical protein
MELLIGLYISVTISLTKIPVLLRPFALIHPAVLSATCHSSWRENLILYTVMKAYFDPSFTMRLLLSVKWPMAHDRESYFSHRSGSSLPTASYPRVISIKPYLLWVAVWPWARDIGPVLSSLLYSIYAMDSKAFSLQNYASAEFLSDQSRGSPFSLIFSNQDTPSPTSPAGSSSSTSSIRTQHQYCLTIGKGKGKGNDRPWLTLRVSSRSPKSKLLPLFIGKDSISGIVELELVKPETVRELKVTVSVVSDMHHKRLTAE